MADLPHPWGIYARLQHNLRREHRIGDRSWGTEAGMDYIRFLARLRPRKKSIELSPPVGGGSVIVAAAVSRCLKILRPPTLKVH